MSNVVIIPQQNTQTKKTYQVEVEGDRYTVIASVLVFRDATRYFNKLKKYTTELNENKEDIELIDKIYDNAIALYEILLGEKKAKKLLSKIDERYDLQTGQAVLLQYAMLLYQIACGMTQEDVNNFFRSEQ